MTKVFPHEEITTKIKGVPYILHGQILINLGNLYKIDIEVDETGKVTISFNIVYAVIHFEPFDESIPEHPGVKPPKKVTLDQVHMELLVRFHETSKNCPRSSRAMELIMETYEKLRTRREQFAHILQEAKTVST